MKSHVTGDSDSKCAHCDHQLVWKAHKAITDKELRRPFYFSKWEYCPNCKTVWFHDEFKVDNKNAAALALRRRQQEYDDFKCPLF